MKFDRIILVLCFCFAFTVFSFSQKLVPCRRVDPQTKKALWGFCDSLTMKEVIKLEYDSTFKMHSGMARVVKDGKTGFVNAAGKLTIPLMYEQGFDFSEGFAFVGKDNRYFFINKMGVNQFKRSFSNTRPKIKLEDLSESTRKIYLGQMYEALKGFRFSEGLSVFVDSSSKMLGYIDTRGNFAIPAKYGYATPFSEGLAFVKESPAEMICINKKGEKQFALPSGYLPMPAEFKNGFAIVISSKGQNYVQKDGKLLLSQPATSAIPFEDGYAIIMKEGEAILINKAGEDVLQQPFKHLSFSPIKKILYYSNNTEKGFGLMDITGRRRTKAAYDNFTKLNDTVMLCKPNGTSIYTLLSTNSGALINGRFIEYEWVEPQKVIRLLGINLFEKMISLDYNVTTGKFMQDGKELAARDNAYLVDEEDRKRDAAELGGVAKYENEFFSLRFPEEMELYKDTVNKTTYRHSTFYFSIVKRTFNGNAANYCSGMKEQLQSGGQYASVQEKSISTNDGTYAYIEAISKEEPGKDKAKLFYLPLDGSVLKLPANTLYVIYGSYFVMDERIDDQRLIKTLQSFKRK